MRKETITIISVFLFGCVWGYCFEVLLLLARGKGFVNRGYLLGPYLPVYGFGLLLCWFISRLLKKYEPLKCCLLVRAVIPQLVKGSEKLSLSKHKPVLVIVLAIMFIDFIFSTILHFLNIN